MQNVQFGLRKTGCAVTIPDHPQAKLMFYLKCMCDVLDLENSSRSLNLLRDYKNYLWLSCNQVDELLALCSLLSPDVFLGKCIFYNEDMCEDSEHAFFELSAVTSEMLITESVLIGGQRRRVHTIMTFSGSFLRKNYFEPMSYYSDRFQRIATSGTSRVEEPYQRRNIIDNPSIPPSVIPPGSSCCSIL